MKAKLDCIPCILRQILRASRFSRLGDEAQERVLRESMEALLKERWDRTPPELAHVAHRIARRYAGGDPYAEVKRKSNDEALALYPEIMEIVNKSSDPLNIAVKVAIAGNIVDFGALEEFDVKETINDVLSRDFAINDYPLFRERLRDAESILYFVDNAGEIVFDRILIEKLREMKDYSITLVVKAGPIINDATEEDARYVGLLDLVDEVRYLSNGEVGYDRSSDEVRRWIDAHDMVISKGQGNYEGLSEHKGIFYLLMVKCPVVAQDIGARVGDVILLYR